MADDVYVEQISGKSYTLPKTMDMHSPHAMAYFHVADSHKRNGYCCVTARQEETDAKSGIYYRESEFGAKLLFAFTFYDDIIIYRNRTYTILGFYDSSLREIGKKFKSGISTHSTGKNLCGSHVYYCRNGEEVLVSLNPSDSKSLIVQYKGKSYERSKDCIGKTLLMYKPMPKHKTASTTNKSNYGYERFHYNGDYENSLRFAEPRPSKRSNRSRPAYPPGSANINSVVTLEEISSKNIFTVKVIAAQSSYKYTGMGGSYYGARTEKLSDPRAGHSVGKMTLITDISPLGQALLGKLTGQDVRVKVGDCITSYRIKSIKN